MAAIHDPRNQSSREEPVPAGAVGDFAVRPATTAIAEDRELLADFVVEAREHLQNIESGLMTIDQDVRNTEAINSVFRAFHTIKGLAGFLELAQLQDVAHEVETLLDGARNETLRLTPAVIDVILDSKDYVSRCVENIEESLIRRRPAETAGDPETLIEGIRLIRSSVERAGTAAAGPDIDEPQIDPDGGSEPDKPASGSPDQAKTRSAATAIKVDTAKLDCLIDMVGEMVIAQSLVQHNPDLASIRNPLLTRNLTQLARITGEIQRSAMSLRMIQIETLFQRMTRLVRDLCRKAGKDVQLICSGGETELDRTIVEQLADPLMHMIRNAIDHGIETAGERKKAGKNPVAKIRLRASHQAGNILIEVSDDGRGMNRDRILSKAIERGIVSAAAQLSDDEVFNLIFQPGFSTAEQVTDISGRGVGMDVVKQHIHSLRGTTEIRTLQNEGTTFYLKLPLTLAIIDGLIAGVGRERYIVPIFTVKEVLRPRAEMLSTIEGTREMVNIRGYVLPVIRLCRRFNIKPLTDDATKRVLIVTEINGKEFCLMVDELLGKQEVVIKSLGTTFQHVTGLAGGAILGDGRVGLILDVAALCPRN